MLSDAALARYCQRVLERAAVFASAGESAHARYLELYRFIRESDKEIERLFDGRSRSNAYVQIAGAVAAGLITSEELGQFTDEAREVVAHLSREPT